MPAEPETRQSEVGAAVCRLAGQDVALLASDMHLGEHDPQTASFFIDALDREAPRITHLFLLGDLFEAWVGDDQDDPIVCMLIDRLNRLARSGVQIGIVRGNRDFLLDAPFPDPDGQPTRFSQRSAATMLNDPCVIDCFGEAVMLAHGDAWCLDDLDYQRFRAQVRSAPWQQQFLSRPRTERQAIARAMRSESEQKRELSDIDQAHVAALLSAEGITRLIHGHTHQPGESMLSAPDADRAARRWVLPDWSAADRRGGFLRLDRTGFHWVDPPRP